LNGQIGIDRMSKLNNKESIYGFVGWLTTREGGAVKLGSSEDCAGLSGLIEEFAKVNNLDSISKNWPKNLVHPSGECSHINNDS